MQRLLFVCFFACLCVSSLQADSVDENHPFWALRRKVHEGGSLFSSQYAQLKEKDKSRRVVKRDRMYPSLPISSDLNSPDRFEPGLYLSKDLADKIKNQHHNLSCLSSYPLYLSVKETENGPRIGVQARVSIFLYTYDAKGDAYILLARSPATAKKEKALTYNDVGGAAKLDNGLPRTFVNCAVDLIPRRTGKLYNFTADYILENSYVCFCQSKNERQMPVIFLKAPKQFGAEELKKALLSQGDKPAKSRDEYVWVKADDLLEYGKRIGANLGQLIKEKGEKDGAEEWAKQLENDSLTSFTETGEKQLRLRLIFAFILKSEEIQKLLQHIQQEK